MGELLRLPVVEVALRGPEGIDIGPGESAQGLHRDDVVNPRPWPHQPVVLSTMWALDDLTEANGAPLMVDGRHPRCPLTGR